MKARKLAKIGRSRKTGPRESNGRLVRAPKPEREDEIMSVAIAQRKRMLPKGTPRKDLRDQKAGDTFGRLRLTSQITEAQYAAGLHWRDTFLAYALVMGVPLPRTLGTLAKLGHIPGHDNSDIPKHIADGIKRKHAEIEAALFDNAREHVAMRNALTNVILMDHQPGDLVMGYLREALNVINRRCMSGS
jgi:hypothetical protein